MASTLHYVDAIFFGHNGQPRIERVPIQTFAMGRGIQVPDVRSVFRSPAPTDYLVVRMQRSQITFVVHFPIQPRPGLRGRVADFVLVCRATSALEGYGDCTAADADLARIAARFAMVYCRGEPAHSRKSDEVLVREPL